MDIIAKKLNFVQEVLRISDEELIDKLEFFLRSERKKSQKEPAPMSIENFNKMIDRSENDIKTGKVTDARELLKTIDKWE